MPKFYSFKAKNGLKKIQFLIAAVAILLILTCVGIFIYSKKNHKSEQITGSQIQKIQFQFEKLELADSGNERGRGMMYRKEMCEMCGMLFVFDSEVERSFWMKNTYVSLDMIFINQNDRVVNIHTNTEPLTTNTYKSLPAKYVLEVPAGWSQDRLKIGDYVDMENLKSQGTEYETVEPENQEK